MRRSILLLVWVASAALAGCSSANRSSTGTDNSPIQEGPTVIPPDDGTYFPTKVGTTWVYRYSSGGKQALTVTNVEDKDGGKVVTVHEVNKDRSTQYHKTMKSSVLGLHLTDDKFRDFFPPLWELKLPVTHGEPWTVATVMKPKGEQVTFEQLWTFTAYGPEQVSVPAGTFKAIRVVREAKVLWPEETTWYAPGVGVVKSEFADGPRSKPRRVEMVLTYFALGTP